MATAMVKTLREMRDAEVVAVASPTPGRAEAFAADWNIPVAHTNVEALADSTIDVAYVGSSNHRHQSDATALLEARIPVLCEKPLTTTLFEAEQVTSLAQQNNTFLMEAMWMRFMPFWDRLVDLIGNGAIGPIRLIRADFGITANADPSRRWFNPLHGGGALLDVGIYPVSFAMGLAGKPRSVKAVGTMTNTGVDAQVGMLFRHDEAVSILDCSFVSDTPIAATVSGPIGRISLLPPFHNSGRLTLSRGDRQIDTFDVGYEGSGYRFEVEEVHRSLESGLMESPLRPLETTLDVLRVLDGIRAAAFEGS